LRLALLLFYEDESLNVLFEKCVSKTLPRHGL